MENLHEKSPCCRTKIIRFGKRRRQCTSCKKTWRAWKKKRGRKTQRAPTSDLLRKVFVEKYTLHQLARRSPSSPAAFRKRFRSLLESFVSKPRRDRFDASSYILIADGLWLKFKKEQWVLYLMALKTPGDNQAIRLDPVLLPGKERYAHWKQVMSTLPKSLRKRIKVLVCDGFRGSRRITRENGWILQRCHFHLIAQMQARLGRKKRVLPGRDIRRAIYYDIREALETANERRLEDLKRSLFFLADDPECPRQFRGITYEFLRNIDDFRTYLRRPELKLPTTSNCIESTGNSIRRICRPLNNPQSFLRWATAFVRTNPFVTCNGKNHQPN